MTTTITPTASERRVEHLRACDRCGIVRRVRDTHARRNLCKDCTQVLTTAEQKRWAA